MSDDLISRKAVIEEVKRYRDAEYSNNDRTSRALSYVVEIIKNQPIAFDKKKVIEELKDMANAAWKNNRNKFCNSDMAIARHRALTDALEIVYKGGTE